MDLLSSSRLRHIYCRSRPLPLPLAMKTARPVLASGKIEASNTHALLWTHLLLCHRSVHIDRTVFRFPMSRQRFCWRVPFCFLSMHCLSLARCRAFHFLPFSCSLLRFCSVAVHFAITGRVGGTVIGNCFQSFWSIDNTMSSWRLIFKFGFILLPLAGYCYWIVKSFKSKV